MWYGLGNPTPGMLFIQGGTNQVDYVSLSLAGGGTFGLESVDLQNLLAERIEVQFLGYRQDGSMVSSSVALGYSSQWITLQFGPGFSSGLTHVNIPSSPWKMDNLVFVPEPGTYALFGLGLMGFVLCRFHRRKKSEEL
jgi:hypothetical protein